MTVTWNIVQLDRHPHQDGLDDVVFTAHWRAEDSEEVGEETYSGSSYGTVSFAAPDPDNFTPYADITEEMAIGWTQDALGDEEVANIEADIAKQIEDAKNPPVESGTPW